MIRLLKSVIIKLFAWLVIIATGMIIIPIAILGSLLSFIWRFISQS